MNATAKAPVKRKVSPTSIIELLNHKSKATPPPKENPTTPAEPIKPGLNSCNSIVISESCLMDLPPGRYHYGMFDGLNKGGPSTDELNEEVHRLNQYIEQEDKRQELVDEQLGFARELIHEINSIVKSLSEKKILKEELIEGVEEIEKQIENSLVEL